ncbi:MAG: SusC/RagA family TonB-linked outer membrane protein [Sediminibacterium sp.]|nr:SusC/RagA family TonB-linked outer membrane protein [Sediminibacterium sp.]TXT34647.1 MAG: TonB-dependent receptor plug [Chitinophagaceae bacterium]
MRKLVTVFLCMVLSLLQLQAQNRTIAGKIIDEKGKPVIGASILVKGTKTGASSKEDGSFSIVAPATAKELVISALNLGTKEVKITKEDIINVTLTSTVENLEEVVVVGYGTKKKSDLTGSVATLKSADIESRPFSSVDKALQGKVAGLQSVAASGQPGAAQNIIIRGISSVNGSSNPLWVIDGIPVNTGDASRLQTTGNLLSTLNPNDIESISVLKDAASQSIYGSRAANGVIVVTTKKGKAGKTKFRFDTEVGQSTTAYKNEKYTPLTAQQYLDITREGLVNAGYSPAVVSGQLTALGLGNGVDFNWLENTTRAGNQQQFNVSAEGGNDKTTFFLSAGRFVQDGTTINSKLTRTNGNVRVTNKATDKLTIGFNLNIGSVSQRAPLAGGAFGNPVLSSYFLLPTRTAYNADGSWNLVSSTLGGLHNTIALTELDKRYLRQTSLRGSAFAEYKILDNLKFRSQYGADYNILEEDQYNNPLHGDGAASNGRAFSYFTRYFNWVWTNTLDLQQNITKGGDLSFNAQLGYEAQKSSGYFNSVQSQQFPPTTALTYPASGATPITASATISDYSFASEFATANFNYQNRFVVSGSFRRDGSSKFSANNKFGNFWSVGGTWNVDKEKFMADVNFITQLKLRSSYGVNGSNTAIGNYDALPLYGYGANYNQLPGSAPANVGDPNLTWELNKPFNVGIDVSVLKNRISLTADYYKRTSTSLLLSVPLSRTSGFTSATRNIGTMQNEGIEFALNIVPVLKKDLRWEIDFNFAHNKNTVMSLPGGNDIINGLFLIRQGVALNTFFVREWAGVDPANGDPLWYADNTHNTKTNAYPGVAARILAGTAQPKYFGSLSSNITFKGFTLSAQFYYNYGNYVYDNWGSYYTGSGFGATFNKVARQFDRWQKPGDIADFPKYVYGGNKNFQNSSTFYLQKGDFVRLRELQIGYNLPKALIEKAKLSNVNFYVRGTNLFTWVKDKNLAFDPEQGTNSTSNLNVFIPRTVTVGLNIAF